MPAVFKSKRYTLDSRLTIKKSASRGYQQCAAAVSLEGGSVLIWLIRLIPIALWADEAPFPRKPCKRKRMTRASCDCCSLGLWRRGYGNWNATKTGEEGGKHKVTGQTWPRCYIPHWEHRGTLRDLVPLRLEHGDLKVSNLRSLCCPVCRQSH